MNALAQTFTFNQSHPVRTVTINQEVWFVAKDVFKTLDVTWHGTRTLAVIPEAWRMVVKLATNLNEGMVKLTTPCEKPKKSGGLQDIHVINFKAVCKIAFRSNKPEADNFTNWATEVIEKVLKTGEYKAPEQKNEPVKKRNYVTNGDMVNIKRLIWMTTHSFRYQRSAVNAVWTRLRTVTGTPSPAVFEVEHLPVIGKEMLDIYQTMVKFEDMVAEAEKIVIKRILQNNENSELILADCEKMIMQSVNDYQQHLSESHQRVFGSDIQHLINRQYLCGTDYPSSNEIAR